MRVVSRIAAMKLQDSRPWCFHGVSMVLPVLCISDLCLAPGLMTGFMTSVMTGFARAVSTLATIQFGRPPRDRKRL
ncbi:MAG: hypothetical protein ABGX76_01545, partial [Cobetia sp.]|uniref:hypothetical protein n=1 Tax=Cobetia sp. TaxID=1873876 RepID=UPI003241CC56